MKKQEHSGMEALVNPMVDKIMEGQPPSKLESPEHQRKRLRAQLMHGLKEYQECFKRAGTLLTDAGFKTHAKWAGKLTEEQMKKMGETGQPVYQMLGIANEEVVQIYQIASQHYAQKAFNNARDLFYLLTSLDGLNGYFWLGLAMSEQQSGHYDNACTLYAVAAELNPNDPTIYLYAAHCLHMQKRDADAIHTLDALIECAGKDKEWQPIKKQAEELKTAWRVAA